MKQGVGHSQSNKRYRLPSAQQVAVLRVLLKSGDSASHGYELMKATNLGPGTLYGMLKRFFDEGYVTKSASLVQGRCRITYTLTAKGVTYAKRAQLDYELEQGLAQQSLHLEGDA